jgi:hypothetical protein
VEPGDANGNVIPFSPEFRSYRPLVSGRSCIPGVAAVQRGMYYEADNQLRQGYARSISAC